MFEAFCIESCHYDSNSVGKMVRTYIRELQLCFSVAQSAVSIYSTQKGNLFSYDFGQSD